VNISFVHFIIRCWMLVMLAASPAHAFYHSVEQSEGPIFQNERCYGAWDKGERAFALYDNLNSPLDKFSQGSVICPRSDEFVPADVFRGNIPLRIAIRQPRTVGHSLDALVHANLMLKKLIEEREAQKERAREVLAGLSIPFMDSPMSLLERAGTPQGAGRYEPSLGRTSIESLTSFGHRQRNTSSGGVVAALPSPKSDIEVSPSPTPQPQKIPVAYEDRNPLPWVIRVPLKIVEYLFSHKIEALIFAMFLYFVIIVLVSIRSRGR
jgi:hypothetical protein